MANGLPSFIKEDKEKLLFNGGPNKEFLAYVPEKYFERSIAEQNGEYIDILGIFDYTVTDTKTGKNIGLKNFRYPTVFTTKPSSVEKVRKAKLTNYMDEMDYRVLHYEDGDEIVPSTSTIQFVGNCEKLRNLWYMLGFILNTIPYDKLPDYILYNIALNGNGYGLNIQVIGFTVSELCRSQKDESIPFRLAKETDLHKLPFYQKILMNLLLMVCLIRLLKIPHLKKYLLVIQIRKNNVKVYTLIGVDFSMCFKQPQTTFRNI